ncbi:MAG: hypothetical protein B1H11_05205, partial [Desulfobacteraceae bacterium 4484_190.1]
PFHIRGKIYKSVHTKGLLRVLLLDPGYVVVEYEKKSCGHFLKLGLEILLAAAALGDFRVCICTETLT